MQPAAEVVEAMMDSAVRAVRQWQYAPPADGPIAFDVVAAVRRTATPAAAPSPGDARLERPMPPPPPPPRPQRARGRADAAATTPPAPGDDGAVRVGGEIKPPMKVRNVNPVYPQDAQTARVQGVVIIEARSRRTAPSAARECCAPSDAGRGRRRRGAAVGVHPTLLNGLAVPVIMTVTVNFTLQ